MQFRSQLLDPVHLHRSMTGTLLGTTKKTSAVDVHLDQPGWRIQVIRFTIMHWVEQRYASPLFFSTLRHHSICTLVLHPTTNFASDSRSSNLIVSLPHSECRSWPYGNRREAPQYTCHLAREKTARTCQHGSQHPTILPRSVHNQRRYHIWNLRHSFPCILDL